MDTTDSESAKRARAPETAAPAAAPPAAEVKKTTAKKPKLTNASKDKPSAAAKPAAAKAKPAGAKAKPAGAKAKPAGAKAKPAGAKAKPAGAKAKPAVAKAKVTGAKAKPAALKTKPTVSKAKVAGAKAKPAAAKAKAAAGKAKPAAGKAKTTAGKDKTTPTKDKTTPAKPKTTPAKAKTTPAKAKGSPAKAKVAGAKAKVAGAKAKVAGAKAKPAGAKAKVAGAKAKSPAAKVKPAAKAKPVSKMDSEPLQVGIDAPPFSVKDQNGSQVSLESFKGEKNVVVFFYPKDNTPGCTKEACTFRDLKAEYDALDCVVLGVSADRETSHGRFIAKFNLNFSLLADTDRSLIRAYGASKIGDKIQRSTVLVDKAGKVAAVWNPILPHRRLPLPPALPPAPPAAATPTPAPSAPLSRAIIRQLAPVTSSLGMNNRRIEGRTRRDAGQLRAGDDVDAGLSGHVAMFSMPDHLDRDSFLSVLKTRVVQDGHAQEDRGLDIEEERPGALPEGFVVQLITEEELAK